MTDGFERVRLVLARARAAGVGCGFWSLAEYGVPVEHLKELGFASPIKTRIPACEDHGCHLIETCRHRAIFADAQPGRSGRKFRLTADGEAAALNVAALAERLRDVPLARRILEAVASAAEPLTGFTLYWCLLERDLQELRQDGRPPVPRLSRPAVRLYLDMLITAGWLHEDSDGFIRLRGG